MDLSTASSRARPGAENLWVYKNMYDQVRAIRVGGLPRTPTMSAYVVMPGRHEAMHGTAYICATRSRTV